MSLLDKIRGKSEADGLHQAASESNDTTIDSQDSGSDASRDADASEPLSCESIVVSLDSDAA
ncbi:hypothetical protein DBR42_06130 [Pelomonas sp. HMWF004]|nr:hypothetical protein DBR42_06130 [Pelomonas sp. HMWF004]